jgi:tetratricopeptide (TPR) repeat protein
LRIVDELPEVRQCAQAATLLAGRTAPPETSVPEIRRIEDELAQLRIQSVAGSHDVVRARLDQLVEDAKRLDYPPTLAEVYLLRAKVVQTTLHSDEGLEPVERDLRAAWEAGLTGDDDVMAARAAVELIDHYNVEQLRFDEGELWEAFAVASVERLERRGLEIATRLREDLELLRGMTLVRKHRHQEAIEVLGEVFRQREEKYGHDHARTIDARSWFANALQAAQQFGPAVELYQDNLEIFRRRHGEDHPAVGVMANNVGLMLRHANRLEESRRLLEFSRETTERYYGPGHPHYQMAASNLGETCYELGDSDCALENYRAAFPENIRHTPTSAGMLNRIAKYTAILYDRGEYDEAKELAEWLRWSSETANRNDFLYHGLLTLGKIELRVGQPDLAIDYLTRSIAVREVAPPYQAVVSVLVAEALLRRAKPGDSKIAHQRLEGALPKFGDEPKWSAEREALQRWLDDPQESANVADTVLREW